MSENLGCNFPISLQPVLFLFVISTFMPQVRHALFQNHPDVFVIQRIKHGFAFLAVFYKIILPQYAQLM